jgi:hypothetical protein
MKQIQYMIIVSLQKLRHTNRGNIFTQHHRVPPIEVTQLADHTSAPESILASVPLHVLCQLLGLIVKLRILRDSELVLLPLRKPHLESVLHVHGERQLGRHRVALDDVDAVAVEDGRGGELHLVVGEVLAEAQARPAVEGGELVGGLAHEAAVPEPPLRLVLTAVLAPDALHPAHGVHGVDHLGALLQHRPVREHLVLHNLYSCTDSEID